MLSTKRLILRRPTKADIDALFEIHSNPETNVYNPAGPMKGLADAVQSFEDWEQSWLEYNYGYWTVLRLNAPERVVGFGGVMKKQLTPRLFDNNLYFRFRPEAWGQGYAGEMVSAALEHTFNTMGQGRVFGITRPNNTASRKTLERAGFSYFSIAEATEDVEGDEPSVLYRLEYATFQQRQADKPC